MLEILSESLHYFQCSTETILLFFMQLEKTPWVHHLGDVGRAGSETG